MIRIAVVEDDFVYQKQLNAYICDYERASGENFQVTNFVDGIDLVEDYNIAFDIIFLDVKMKHLDGMQTAKKIREYDRNVIIIFITNMAEFAIQGYQVEAMDYVLKPINYFAFSQELQKAVKKVREKSAFFLHIMRESSMIRLDAATIYYMESQGHNVVFHTKDGVFVSRDSLKNLEQKLIGRHFSRCNSCYLVNLAHVERVDKNLVTVAGEELQMSRPRKKSFMEDLAQFIGGE